MIYLDYASGTPTDKRVLDNYIDVTNNYIGNPNSNHSLGKKSKDLIDKATKEIAKTLNILPEEIIYTSGSTESNNLAIKGVCDRYKNRGKHIIISPLEHNSIIGPLTTLTEKGYSIDIVPLDKNGKVDLNALKKLIRNDTILVSITACDSELGILQPIEEIADLLKDYPNIIFHSDLTGVMGKIKINLDNIDLITFSPHKFYGINGIGVLIKKKNIFLTPQIEGGRSTTIYRAGTPITPLISSLNTCLNLYLNDIDKRYDYVKKINDDVRSFLEKYDDIYINSPKDNLPYILNFSFKGIKSDKFTDLLDQNNIIVSTKTSCCPVNMPSKLVYAYTKDKTLASSSIRLSFSHLTNKEEIEKFKKIFDKCYKEVKNGKI